MEVKITKDLSSHFERQDPINPDLAYTSSSWDDFLSRIYVLEDLGIKIPTSKAESIAELADYLGQIEAWVVDYLETMTPTTTKGVTIHDMLRQVMRSIANVKDNWVRAPLNQSHEVWVGSKGSRTLETVIEGNEIIFKAKVTLRLAPGIHYALPPVTDWTSHIRPRLKIDTKRFSSECIGASRRIIKVDDFTTVVEGEELARFIAEPNVIIRLMEE